MLAGSRHFKVANGTVAMLRYHLVWSTRRRRPVLTGEVAERLKVLLDETARSIGVDILKWNIAPDHVHLYVLATPSLAPNQIVHRLKSGSASLRDEFAELRKLPSMWTSACLVSSAPSLRHEDIQLYIETQSKSA
jgi:putative transposase